MTTFALLRTIVAFGVFFLAILAVKSIGAFFFGVFVGVPIIAISVTPIIVAFAVGSTPTGFSIVSLEVMRGLVPPGRADIRFSKEGWLIAASVLLLG